jgi:arsenate reductase-like glutaredoxin family protein
MITLGDIAEIAEISKSSALKMAARNGWGNRKVIRNNKRINLYSISRDDVKKAIVQTAEQKQKKRLAALKIATQAEAEKIADQHQLSTEPQLMTVEQIRQLMGVNRSRVREIIQRARWESQKLLKCGRWTLHYMISKKQIVDAATDYFNSVAIFEKPKGCARLPFDTGWVCEYGEAPTLTILKQLDELSWPWGAHPAKSIIKPRELFV